MQICSLVFCLFIRSSAHPSSTIIIGLTVVIPLVSSFLLLCHRHHLSTHAHRSHPPHKKTRRMPSVFVLREKIFSSFFLLFFFFFFRYSRAYLQNRKKEKKKKKRRRRSKRQNDDYIDTRTFVENRQ